MKSRFLKAALAVVSACTLMACCPEKENNAAQDAAKTAAPVCQSGSNETSNKSVNMAGSLDFIGFACLI